MQPRGAGSCGHSLAGHCSQNSLGVSIFSVQRTGQLFGRGNKAASVCHPRGWGEGGGKEIREPSEKSRTVARPGFPGAPTLVPRDGEEGLRAEDELRPPLYAAEECSLLSPHSHSLLGMGLRQRGLWLNQHSRLYSLTNICSAPTAVPRFSKPQGAATKTLPKVKALLDEVAHRKRLGGLRSSLGRGDQRLTHAGKSQAPSITVL